VVELDFKDPDYDAVYKLRMECIERIRAPGFDLKALKQHYRENPGDFISDWGMTFDPRNVEIGLPAIVPFVLFKRQLQFIEWLHERWKGREDGLCEKSRDMGVSWLCVAFAHWMWQFHPSTVVGFGSRKEEYVDKLGDPKSLFWKQREYIKLLPKEFQPVGYDEKIHAPSMRIVNPETGSAIVGEAGDNIGRGNRTSIYFKDESAFYEHAESIDAALSQTSNCKIDVSTPNGSGNPFYRKRHGGRVKVFVFDWKDDPRKGKDWYQKQVEQADDPVIIAQEVDRDYTASVSNAYIPGKVVTAAQMRGPSDVMAIGPLQVGVDVARFGDDKCVITFRQGRVVYPQIVFGKVDVVDCAGRVADEIRLRPEPVKQIAVDTIGIGSGVADMLRRDKKFGTKVVDVNSSLRLDDGQNYNLRSRIWRDMREYLKAGASLPTDPDLTTDLTALQYSYRAGALLMESKDDAKKRGMKSPDRADSIALTFAYPVDEDDNGPPPNAPQWAVIDELTGY
jgi:phage terminase large subunit